MREIKFRFWYTGNLGKGEMVFWPKDNLDLNAYMKDTSNCMQYTGLLDKNGKEIYEGDIVKDDEGFITDVQFNEGVFYIQNIPERVLRNYEVEVIGNIYENTNLLKEN